VVEAVEGAELLLSLVRADRSRASLLLGANLGSQRILRTSQLTPVPPIC
jgi:hypothetical protein